MMGGCVSMLMQQDAARNVPDRGCPRKQNKNET